MVRLTWSATWFAMLRAPAFIIQRWKSATGSLPRDEPRPPAWLRPPLWPLALAWPLPEGRSLVRGPLLGVGLSPESVALPHGSRLRGPLFSLSRGLLSCGPLSGGLLPSELLPCGLLLCGLLLCDGLPPGCGALPCGSPSTGWPSSWGSDHLRLLPRWFRFPFRTQ